MYTRGKITLVTLYLVFNFNAKKKKQQQQSFVFFEKNYFTKRSLFLFITVRNGTIF